MSIDTRCKCFGIAGLLAGLLTVSGLVLAQSAIHKNGFDVKTGWIKGGFDTQYDEVAHRIDDQNPHSGQGCELIEVNIKEAKADGYVRYAYSVGKAPINEELRIALYLRGNRPGIQLMARIVLPKERDPANLANVLTTYIRGDTYDQVGRWQQLEISRPANLSKLQQQLLAADQKRALDFTGAYVDYIVLNLNGGPGSTKVWIDDLEVGPVLSGPPVQPAARADNNTPTIPTSNAKPAARNALVKFDGGRLVIGDKRVVFRAVRYSDTVLSILRNAGFNTVCFDRNVNPTMIGEASELGFWLAPDFSVLDDKGQARAATDISTQISRYADKDSVLFWHLAGFCGAEQIPDVARGLQAARTADNSHPLAADISDGVVAYANNVNMVGASRFPLMTTMELHAYRNWLESRRKLLQLSHPGAFTYTWIQTHVPDYFAELLYHQNAKAEFKDPVGPQPEQIRLLAYTALACGYRGLGFWSDRFLADSHQGRDRLLCCALLNQEIDMIEPLLVSVEDGPQWIETSVPEVKAAVLRCSQGVLVLPIWHGSFSQFVPGQAAAAKLTVTVPQVPVTCQAWEVSPGEVRGLKMERVERGMRVTLNEFGLTSMIVFASDTNLMGRFQDQARQRREKAALWSYQLALYEYEKVVKTQGQLELVGAAIPDANNLLADANQRLQKTKTLLDAHNFADAYHEAERALRPARILMRAHWEKAVRGMDSPATSPYAVSFFTLPEHWKFMAEFGRASAGQNLLPGGDFEMSPDRKQENWNVSQTSATGDVDMIADRVQDMLPLKSGKGTEPLKTAKGTESLKAAKGTESSKTAKETEPQRPIEGKQCARLQIKTKEGKATPFVLERSRIALTSPDVKLPPGTIVQISGWINIPGPIAGSPDGVLFYDSAGGEELSVRLAGVTAWKKFTLYRRVPASGTIHVTVALTGLGTAYFDDLRIQPCLPSSSGVIPAGK